MSSGDGHGARGAESSPARRRRGGGSWQDLVAHESGLGFMPGALGSPWGENVLKDHVIICGTVFLA